MVHCRGMPCSIGSGVGFWRISVVSLYIRLGVGVAVSSFLSRLSTTAVVLGLAFCCSRSAVAVCDRVLFEPVGCPTKSALGTEPDRLVLRDTAKEKATVWELVHLSHERKDLTFLIVDVDRRMALGTRGGHFLFVPYDETSKDNPNLRWLLRPASPALFIISITDSTHLSLAVKGQTILLAPYQPAQGKIFLIKIKDSITGNLCRLTVFSPQGRQTEPEQAQFLFHSLLPSMQIL